jgi:hypothetical protein
LNPNHANSLDLTSGLWAGHYEQGGEKHPQEATLEFADGLIRGDGRDGLGLFSIEGEYRVEAARVRVGWIKTYDNAHSVLYLGVLESGIIRGHWDISGSKDRFALSSKLAPTS